MTPVFLCAQLVTSYGVSQQQPGKLFTHLYGVLPSVAPSDLELYGTAMLNLVTNSATVPMLAAVGVTKAVMLLPPWDAAKVRCVPRASEPWAASGTLNPNFHQVWPFRGLQAG